MDGYLREATEDDLDLLFEWVNEEGTRESAFSTDKIKYEDHKKWFEKTLKDSNIKQYIYMVGDKAIGQIRVDIREMEGEVDYSISLDNRCMGYGTDMLKKLAMLIKADFPNLKKLIAKVKPDNIASQRAFLNTGYSRLYELFELDLNGLQEAEETEIKYEGGVVYLSNNNNSLELCEWISKRVYTTIYSEKVYLEQIKNRKPEFIVSYNYNYIITSDIINFMNGKIINLHISLLPWNRGFSPNIWSFVDDTPKGVTIHQISPELDCGKIIYQKECCFNPDNETFVSTYDKLNRTIVELFKIHWEEIRNGDYTLSIQQGEGSYHKKKELDRLMEKIPFKWEDNIGEFLNRYHQQFG